MTLPRCGDRRQEAPPQDALFSTAIVPRAIPTPRAPRDNAQYLAAQVIRSQLEEGSYPAVQSPGYDTFVIRSQRACAISCAHRVHPSPPYPIISASGSVPLSLRHCFLSAHLLRHRTKESDHVHDIYFRNPRAPICAWTSRLVRLQKGDNPLYVTFPCRLPCLTSAASDSVGPHAGVTFLVPEASPLDLICAIISQMVLLSQYIWASV
jgi:hypothetical protein